MNPEYDKQGVTIYCGDALQTLKEMPAESVHCCVSSPPYWGLRDYGTATWDGGDAACDHKAPSRFDYGLKSGLGPTGVQDQASNLGSGSVQYYRDICGKCGAKRIDQQLGLEATPEEYVEKMVAVFEEVRRVLRKDGTCWVNMGDGYANDGKWGGETGGKQHYLGESNRKRVGREKRRTGLKPKDLIGMPWRLAFALRDAGWYLRADMPWVKRAAMPESAKDRPGHALEYVFMLAKSQRYYFDMEAVRRQPSGITGGACFGGPMKKEKAEQKIGGAVRTQQRAATKEDWERYASTGRQWRTADLWFESVKPPHGLVWVDDEMVGFDVNPKGFPGAHFATFPPRLIEPMILAGCPEGGTVLDPFIGSGTTAEVARRLGRRCIGIELNPDYVAEHVAKRLEQGLLF